VKGAVDLVWGVHAGSLDTAGDAFTAGDYVTVLPAKDYAALTAENDALRARVAELTEIAGLCKTETLSACARVAELEGLLREAASGESGFACPTRLFDRMRAALTPKGGET
jgi:hypothetical protein